MRVVDEHECDTLRFQNIIDKSSVIAVQEMVKDTKNKVERLGWYLVNYQEHAPNVAIGIKYCPYCGKKLRDK